MKVRGVIGVMEAYNREYKIDIPKKPNKLKAEIVSFLNSEGGEILLGVTDEGIINRELIMQKRKEWEEILSNWIVTAFSPDPSKNIYIYPDEIPFRIKILKGKNKPYFYKDGEGFNAQGVYIRVGSTKRIASFDEIQRMIRFHSSSDFENISTKRKDLTFDYLENKFSNKNIRFDKYALSLVNEEGEYNNAALLLSDQNPTISKFAVFQGKDVSIFLDKKEFRGSILKQLDETLYFSSLSNRKKIIISEKAERVEHLDIPKRALREAIVNCFCHRDWTLSGDIKIEFYDDRVQIFSPGGLPDGLTLENIKKGMVAKRNRIVVDVLDKIDIIENYASGVRRIFNDYEGFEKEPDYYISDNGVRLTLFNRNYFETMATQNDTQNDIQNDTQNDTQNDIFKQERKLSIRYEKILDNMKRNIYITGKELSEMLGVSQSTIRRDINKLKELEIVEYVGSSKKGYWKIKKL